MKVSTLTFTVAIRAAPDHPVTEGGAGRFQFSMAVPGDAPVNGDATHSHTPDVLIPRTPALPTDAPVAVDDHVALVEDRRDASLAGAPVDSESQTTETLTPDLAAYIERCVDMAAEQVVEDAVERAMQSFCEYELDSHIEEKLRGERLADRDEFEQLESRVDDLEEGYNGVDADDLDVIKSDMAELSDKVDLLQVLTGSVAGLKATCDALACRVAELELMGAGRITHTTTNSARSRKRAN